MGDGDPFVSSLIVKFFIKFQSLVSGTCWVEEKILRK